MKKTLKNWLVDEVGEDYLDSVLQREKVDSKHLDEKGTVSEFPTHRVFVSEHTIWISPDSQDTECLWVN